MELGSPDRQREAPKQGRRTALLWLIGAAVLATLLFIASARGHRAAGGESTGASDTQVVLLPGAPPVSVATAALYAADDPWLSYLADERTCPGGERTDLSVYQQEQVMLCLIDWARRRHGLNPLPQSALLASTALQKAGKIVRCHDFAHAACGIDPAADIHAAQYPGAFGENLYIAGGRAGAPRAALDGWLNSPEHRENVFRAQWHSQGIALVKLAEFAPYHDMSLWVSHFGSQ